MLRFESVDTLISYLESERVKGERFATRFILLSGCNTWDDFILKMANQVDKIIYLSKYCTSPNVLPNMHKLMQDFKEVEKYYDSVLLLPLAECIRLNPVDQKILRSLALLPTNKIRRLYVHLLNVEEYFYQEMEHIVRFKAGGLPEICLLYGEGRAEVVVAPFVADHINIQLVNGIQEYLSLWEKGSIRKAWLVTSLAQHLPILQTQSECRLFHYPSAFVYLNSNFVNGLLKEEWGSQEQWEWLASKVQAGDDLDRLAGNILNVAGFNAEQLFTLWNSLGYEFRWLIWLWSKLRSERGTYLNYVLNKHNHIDNLFDYVSISIFDLPLSLDLIRERKELMQRLNINLLPSEFWELYKVIEDPIKQLAVLTDLSTEELNQIVLCLQKLITSYPYSEWWDYLEVICPKLAWYLQPVTTGDEFADTYFSVYKICRIMDKTNDELEKLINHWAIDQLIWNYRPRGDIVDRYRKKETKIVWVDGMGVEWAGLLTQLLSRKNEDIECEIVIARSNLPTITETNNEWGAEDKIIRDLDDIAHHYDYQFPDSFIKTFGIIEDIANRTLALLSRYENIIITSDHGLSRFAAISNNKHAMPEGAEVKAIGRYALLPSKNYDISNNLWLVYEDNAIWLTHNQFRGGGAWRGEIHGGATPEECLVPVIVVRRTSLVEPKFEVINSNVKLSTKNTGTLDIRCNRKLTELDLRLFGQLVKGKTKDGFIWTFELKDLEVGKYTGNLCRSSRILDKVSFTVSRGLIEDDLGL